MTLGEVTICGERLLLHPWRAAFWEKENTLLLADLHLGKVTHFRKAGIAVPPEVSDANWDKLISLLVDFQPGRVIFLGDLFHSDYNREWEELRNLIHQFHSSHFELVPGNHDRLKAEDYAAAGIKVHPSQLDLGPFQLTHHPPEGHAGRDARPVPGARYILAGHIHPCVTLQGVGRQRLRLPCFYFGSQYGLLPAFGAFTGTARIRPAAGDHVFVIVNEKVVPM